MKFKKTIAIISAMVLTISVLAGCARPSDAGKTSVTISGSTSVQPLSEELAKAFKEKNPDVTIDIQGGGSGVGIKAAADRVADIGASSRDLKTEEKGLKEFKIAVDGIAVIVNPANGITNLTKEQISKIYTGAITNWKEVGGQDATIIVVSREEGSGTRGAFIELTGVEAKEGDKKVDKTIASAITQGSTGAVITTVAGDPNAIGYASFGSITGKNDIKAISVDGTVISDENIYSGSYKISRPFLYLTKEDPQGAAKAFIDFVLSAEGQEIVAKHGYLKTVK